jgi:dihydrofolate reductase
MKIAIIVAIDANRGIGKDNDLLWHLPNDMKFFKEKTMDNIVVMGRKNFESIPEKFRPLPNRENVILTRNKDLKADKCLVLHSFEEVMNHFNDEEDRTMFIIGGGEIYKQALKMDIVDEMYVTHVQESFDADTFFPEIDLRAWRRSKVATHSKDEKHCADFEIWKYEIIGGDY